MKFRACEELLFEQAICSTSHLRKINEQSNCLWDTTTEYSHLLGQFRDSFRLLEIIIFMYVFRGLRKLKFIQKHVLHHQEPSQNDPGQNPETSFLSYFFRKIRSK